MVYAYPPNFVSIGLFCRLLLAKNTICAVFWSSAFSVVANWQQSDKVEHGCTTTNLLISDVQKRDEETDRQKNSTFLATPAAGEIRATPNLHGDRGPRALSCTSKTFGGLTHTFAARGTANLGVTGHPQLKTLITPKPLEQIQRNFNS